MVEAAIGNTEPELCCGSAASGALTMIKSISYWSMKEGLSNNHPIEDALEKYQVD